MHTLIPAEFLGIPVSILDHLGRRWLTARDVGRCLGYAEEFARQAVIKLYSRHADEFGADDSCEVNLTSQGQMREFRIFSQTGCILLAMFANTARAKDFRAWAKRVLAGDAPPPRQDRAPVLPGRPRITRAVERQALELFAAGLALPSIARHLGVSVASVSLLVNGKFRFAPGSGEDETTPELIAAVAARHRERVQAQIASQFCASAANQALVQTLDRLGQRMLAALEG